MIDGKRIKSGRIPIQYYDSRYYLLGVNKLQVCKNLWVDPKTEKIKIISISGDLSYSEAEVFEAGANSFFTKSINLENLLSFFNDWPSQNCINNHYIST